jgi:hypothetical protein
MRAFMTAMVFFLLAAAFPAQAAFQAESIEGWRVYVDGGVPKDLADKIRAALHDKLQTITTLLPPPRIEELRHVPIFVFQGAGKRAGSGAYYANGSDFAEDGAEPPEGVQGGVAIADPQAVLDWLDRVPSGILHELSHAYHDQVLGMDNPAILAAWQHAVDAHLYENVKRANGEVAAKSYALTNKAEYFALLTQAYYWKSGYYPFDKADLKSYDPQGYAAVRSAWEDRPGPQPQFKISKPAPPGCPSGYASRQRNMKAVISVHNWTDAPLTFTWVRPDGTKVPYKDIPAGGYRSQPTYASQVWEIGAAGKCLAGLIVGPLGQHVDVMP